jgi:hypothetical protein
LKKLSLTGLIQNEDSFVSLAELMKFIPTFRYLDLGTDFSLTSAHIDKFLSQLVY